MMTSRSRPLAPLARAPRELSSLELLGGVLRGEPRASSVPARLRALVDDDDALVLLALEPDVTGLSERARIRLLCAVELGMRVASELATVSAPPLPDPLAVAAWGTRLLPLDHEELWLLALDGRNGLRAARRVAAGGLHGLSVALGDPVRIALRSGASAFVLVHNHPSGDPTPSPEDERFTTRVAEAATLIGIPLVDHVVVARGGAHVSFMERGLLAAP